MTRLRKYSYRDDRQIEEFLEQIQDGALGETTVEREGQKSRHGRIGMKGVAEGDLGSVSSTSESYTLAPTPVSRAAQLERWLGDDVEPLGPMDAKAFGQIERGEFVRFEGTLEVPELVRMTYLGASVGRLAGIAQAFGQQLDGADEILSQIEALKRLVELDGFPIIAQERSGGAGIMFIARPDLIVGQPLELHGDEVTVFGRVKRTIAAGQRLTQDELLPSLSQHLPKPNREQRRASGSESKSIELIGPAVLIEPIAIYS